MKPAKRNIIAAQALVKRYNTLSLSQIQKAWKERIEWSWHPVDGEGVAQVLTGFGSTTTCTLCKSVDGVCQKCIYQTELGCGDDSEEYCIPEQVKKTYRAIQRAKGPISLQKALRNRAKVIKSILKDLKKGAKK
jgi:hypothetical protein